MMNESVTVREQAGVRRLPSSRAGRQREWKRALPAMQGLLPIDRSQVPGGCARRRDAGRAGHPRGARLREDRRDAGGDRPVHDAAADRRVRRPRSSRHLVVAADSATAIILAAALTGLAAAGSRRYVRLAGLAAVLTAAMLLLARLARLGFLANFLSRTVLIGFLTGVGIQVAAGQLPDMLGVAAAGKRPRRGCWTRCARSRTSIGRPGNVGRGHPGRARGAQDHPRIPGPLIAVIIAISVSRAADLAGAASPWSDRSRAAFRAWGCRP